MCACSAEQNRAANRYKRRKMWTIEKNQAAVIE
jgi:hypothetical protein